jgi:hypothetical protein
VTPEEIRAQLERLTAAEAFRASGRLTAFLKFTVEKTPAGEEDDL